MNGRVIGTGGGSVVDVVLVEVAAKDVAVSGAARVVVVGTIEALVNGGSVSGVVWPA